MSIARLFFSAHKDESISALELAAYILQRSELKFQNSDKRLTLPQLQKMMVILCGLFELKFDEELLSEKPIVLVNGNLQRLAYSNVLQKLIAFGAHGITEIPASMQSMSIEHALTPEQLEFIKSFVNEFSDCECFRMSFTNRFLDHTTIDQFSYSGIALEMLDRLELSEDIFHGDYESQIRNIKESLKNKYLKPELRDEVELLAYDEDAKLLAMFDQSIDTSKHKPFVEISEDIRNEYLRQVIRPERQQVSRELGPLDTTTLQK